MDLVLSQHSQTQARPEDITMREVEGYEMLNTPMEEPLGDQEDFGDFDMFCEYEPLDPEQPRNKPGSEGAGQSLLDQSKVTTAKNKTLEGVGDPLENAGSINLFNTVLDQSVIPPAADDGHVPEPAPVMGAAAEESLVLAPLDATLLTSGRGAGRRKRKLIVDRVKNFTPQQIRAQLGDTADIVFTHVDLAPPTKKLMHGLETRSVEKLFALPGMLIGSREIERIYKAHLVTRKVENLDKAVELHEPSMVVPVGTPKKLGAKKRMADQSVEQLRQNLENQEEMSIFPGNEEQVTNFPPEADVTGNLRSRNSCVDLGTPPGTPKAATKKRIFDDNYLDPAVIFSFDVSINEEVAPPPGGDLEGSKEMVSEQQEEEAQGSKETSQEYEERIVNKRATEMHQLIKSRFEEEEICGNQISFLSLCTGSGENLRRKQVAQNFYTMLVLKKAQAVELEQREAFGEIFVSKGNRFQTAAL